MPVFEVALAEAWAMRPDALAQLLTIADRNHEVSEEALERYRAEYSEKAERMRIRDDVAIIDMRGPLFKRANLLQAISGASSYEIMARDFQLALDDPKVAGILLNVDSPGGSVSGCDELAQQIFEARGVKPIIAYVSGQGCSAAYWLASSADKIVLSEASVVGSIGVVLGIEDRSEQDKAKGIRHVEFVSSRAPGKRPDYDTDAGKAAIQRRVDDLEAIFIANVARNRGVPEDTVIKDFGAGGVEIGARAVELRMADEVGSFESAFAQLTNGGSRRSPKRSTRSSLVSKTEGVPSAEDGITAEDVSKARADAQTAAKARIKAIVTSEEAKGREDLANHFAYDTDMTAEAAIAALKVAPKASKEDAPASDPEKDYEQRKAAAGTLGFADERGGEPSAKVNPMMAAVENLNSRNK